MKRVLIAFTLLVTLPLMAVAQDNYETPIYKWLKKTAIDSKAYTMLEVYRTENPDERDNFFITYNINKEGVFQSAIMFNQSEIKYEYTDGKLTKDVFSVPGGIIYTTSYTYNKQGQLIEKKTAFKAPDAEEEVPAGISTYTYNDGGQLAEIAISESEDIDGGESTEISFSYNKSGLMERVVTIKTTEDDVYKTVEYYSYDAEGKLTESTEETIWGDGTSDGIVTKTYTYSEGLTVTEKTTGIGEEYYMIYTFTK